MNSPYLLFLCFCVFEKCILTHFQASIDGTPVMRPLFVEYPNDVMTYAIQDTFLLGRDLLVTPVTRDGAVDAHVFFPHGLWYDVDTHERFGYGGGRLVSVPAPLDKIPGMRWC
jgi:alpha-glucosidase (family GH31 glycosyl hydrolase)